MSLGATALVLSWAAIVVLASALAGVLQRLHRLEMAVQDLPAAGGAGAAPSSPLSTGPAPSIEGVDLAPGTGVVLLFADRACRSCLRVLPVVTETAGRVGVPVHVLWSGPPPGADGPPDRAEQGVTHHGDAGAAYAAYRVVAAPWLTVVGAAGEIRSSGPAGSDPRVATLLEPLAHAADPAEADDRAEVDR